MTEFEEIKNALMRVDPEYVEINEKHYLGHGNWGKEISFPVRYEILYLEFDEYGTLLTYQGF